MTEPDRIWINDKWEAYLRPTFDGDTSGYVRADLARPTPLAEALAVPEVKALVEALRDLFGAVCGDTGFAQCVRDHSGTAYPWPALDLAEERALAALRAIGEGKA